VNLISTPRGYVAMNFGCTPRTAAAADPTLRKIVDSI
jgi:hypothetical protein